MTLAERVEQLRQQHGSFRAAARVLDIDVSYLWRISAGKKVNPSDTLLRRMGLKRVTTYELRKP